MEIKKSSSSQEKSFNIIDGCIECGKCVRNCEMLKTYTHSPKALFTDVMDHKVPFSCHLCDHCRSVCPKDIDLKSAFLSLRRDAQDQMNIKTIAVDFHQKSSFSPIFTSRAKASKKVFFPGCALSAHDPDMVLTLYDYIKDDHMSIWMNCCGNPTYTLGKTKPYNKQLESLMSSFNDNGIGEVIVACQNCYKMFAEQTNLKVTSVFEILDNMALPVETIRFNQSLVLHDPCPTRKYDVIHSSVRSILDKLSIDYSEFKYNRRQTQCCGAGAMVAVTNPVITQLQSNNRANQSDAQTIITYCQECVETLGRDKDTLHVLDILFNNGVKKEPVKTLKKWSNRRVIKIKIDKIK